MIRPSSTIMMVGHPIIVGPVTLAALAMIAAAFQDPDRVIGAFAMLGLCYPFVRANAARTEYLTWKRAWDGIDQPAPARTPATSAGPAAWRPWAGVAMLVALGLFFAAHASDPTYAVGLVWLIVTGIVAGAFALWRRHASHAPARTKQVPVTVCISRPLMPVPSLRDAYLALPDHAKRVLGLPVRR